MIHFNGDYNYTAPKIQFLTIPFHPNGEVCIIIVLVTYGTFHCIVNGRTGEVFLNISQTWCVENSISQLFHNLLVRPLYMCMCEVGVYLLAIYMYMCDTSACTAGYI